MGKSTAVRHTKGYYLAYSAVGETALGAALWVWTVSSSAARPREFGTEVPGVSWGALLVAASVVTAAVGVLIVLSRTVSRTLRRVVGLTGAVSAGTLGPIALQLMVRPSMAAFLAAVAVLGMGVSTTGMMRAQFIGELDPRAARSA